MEEDLTLTEALYALDTTMEEDMEDYGKEVTRLAIKHINSTPKLYNYIKSNAKYEMAVRDSAVTWAKNNNNEFGPLFVTELDMVDWAEVEKMV